RFVHDQIRESILEEVPPAELRRLHARAAEHLVEHQGDQHTAWPTIAHHFERAERFDERSSTPCGRPGTPPTCTPTGPRSSCTRWASAPPPAAGWRCPTRSGSSGATPTRRWATTSRRW